jgi:preprotein translocase subunit SecD
VIAELPPEGATTTTSTTAVPGAPATDSTTTTSTTISPDDEAARAAVASCDVNQLATLTEIPTTNLADDDRDTCVVLPVKDGGGSRLYLGPTALTGQGVAGAKREFQQGQGYAVSVEFNDEGAQAFDQLAATSFPLPSPQNQVAIVLDGVVQSAPAFQQASFSGDVQITGNFTGDEADDLATIVDYGALPVQLEELTVQNVSPTLGQDQLDAGIIAGIIGLLLVALYMLVYYRVLGLVVILGILVTGGATYAFVSYLGATAGLTLTLAGITGLIVSVGVTVDSYVVYFERLKDEVRSGKTVRSSVDRGFARSFQTILAADLVSLIGATVLYMLAIGSVRGFAFFLGLATVLDLVISYFFMHPLVVLLARRPGFLRARYVGIASGLDASEATA